MAITIDDKHILVDLATMEEVRGATDIDDSGVASITKTGYDNQVQTTRLQMQHGVWRIVRRR
jgi:hypothetical protein